MPRQITVLRTPQARMLLSLTLAWMCAAAAPTAAQERVAVLPFRELGEMAGSGLGSTMAWILTMNLAKASSLIVLDQPVVERTLRSLGLPEAPTGDPEKAREVGTRLGARWLVLGSVAEGEGEITVEGRVLDMVAGAYGGADTVRGPSGESFDLGDRLSSEVLRILTGESVRFGTRSPARFQKVLKLTAADLARFPEISGYAVLYEDPELGWKLGARCDGDFPRSCSSVRFLASQDLRRQSPTRGVDGLAVIGYLGGGNGSLSTYWPEVTLDGKDEKLILEVEPLSAIVSEEFFNVHRPEGQRIGARLFEVRVIVSVVHRSSIFASPGT